MTILCDTPTNKGKQCYQYVDTEVHPTSCHIHRPNGNFQHQKRLGNLKRDKQPKEKLRDIKMSIASEMLSRSCRMRPFVGKCYDPTGIHCDTIEEMVTIVLMGEKKRGRLTQEEKDWINSWKEIVGG